MKLEIGGWTVATVHNRPNMLEISSDQAYGKVTLTAGGETAFSVGINSTMGKLVLLTSASHEETDDEPERP